MKRIQPGHWLAGLLLMGVGASLAFRTDANVAPAVLSAATQQQVVVRWTPDAADTKKPFVDVIGLKPATLQRLSDANWKLPQWQRLLSVYAGKQEADSSLPPMIGTYRVRESVLRFEPEFPLEPGLIYKAVFYPGHLPDGHDSKVQPITSVFRSPLRNASPTTVVSKVFPTTDLLPENLLKFYVHFSAPMSRGHIYDHIHLRDAAGKEIDLPFLEIDEELWDPAMTRLTLFIDPGRIKRGVLPLEDVGPALEAGKDYTLVIGREWRDGAGNPLKETFQKSFKVGPPDREPPDPAQWKIQPPKAGTRESVTLTFPEHMDSALALRLIRVTAESGEAVEGNAELGDAERRWTFTPTAAWPSGPYKIAVQTTIEDMAGNNIGKPFDVDLFETVQRRLATSIVKLSFRIQ